jgi:hypothetical protein
LTAFAAPTNYDYGQGYCDPPDGQQCPDGYVFNEQINGCVPVTTDGVPTDGCPEGTTYDPQLGFCVQDQCGCPFGTYMNPDTQQCEPYINDEEGCWTTQISVPVCEDVTPTPHPECDRDEHWNPDTQQCERDPTNCSEIGNQQACSASGCDWICTARNRNGACIAFACTD